MYIFCTFNFMIKTLKTITQKKLGFKIEDYNSSRRLSEIIYTETGIEISYNTLRRFFGIVKPVKPSNYTLDMLWRCLMVLRVTPIL